MDVIPEAEQAGSHAEGGWWTDMELLFHAD
jgi:hypothetical protein